jgi:ATP synthase protein I
VEPSIQAPLTADKSAQTLVEVTSLEDETDDFHPMTAQEAQAWRARQPALSVWRVVGVQLVLAMVLAGLAGVVGARPVIAWSLMYGALAVVVPAALFARGLTSRLASTNAVAAASSFAVWQGVKLVLTVLMLALAPRVLNDVSWPALVSGLVVDDESLLVGAGLGQTHKSDAAELI